jgi:hypothetical protein
MEVRRREVHGPCSRVLPLTLRQVVPAYTVTSGSLSPQHGTSTGCGWRNGLQIWRVAANILYKQSRTADKGWYSSLGVGRGANNSSP